MIDTHCHLTFPDLRGRLDAVLADAAAAGVDRLITIGTSPEQSAACVALAGEHGHVFATVGVHPHEAAKHHDRAAVIDPLTRLLETHGGHIVALGEMGLDTHYDDPPLADQRRLLAWQLGLAAARPELPIVIHNRKATEDTLAALADHGIAGERCVFHCFTGTPADAELILGYGATLGFTGIVTFRSAAEVADASDRVPLDRLLIETDAPYLTPEPFRKVRPNEPKYVPHVAAFLAKRRGMALKDFAAAVDANAERVFGLNERGVH